MDGAHHIRYIIYYTVHQITRRIQVHSFRGVDTVDSTCRIQRTDGTRDILEYISYTPYNMSMYNTARIAADGYRIQAYTCAAVPNTHTTACIVYSIACI